MSLDRLIPGSGTVGAVTGDDLMDDIQEELTGLWDRSHLKLTSIGGTANAVTATATPALTGSLADGMRFTIIPTADNTGAVTLAIGALSAVSVVDRDDNALSSGLWKSGRAMVVEYDGTLGKFRVLEDISVASTGFSTGDVKLTIKTAADTGWVMMNDGTIGDGSSGASTRANSDTVNLFTLLYNNLSDTAAPLLTSAGASTTRAAQGSAATAYANHCRITLFKVLGRAIAGAGAGSGLTSRALGATAGAETHTLTTAELPNQTYNYNFNTSSGNTSSFPSSVDSGGDFNMANTALVSNTGVVTDNNGGGAHTIVQPSVFLNVMIML